MIRRIFVNVSRGMTDKTAVCIFPWEMALLERIHGGDVEEVSIDEMCTIKGHLKIEKNKTRVKRQDGVESEAPPDLRAQLEAMVTVGEDEDPTADPDAEYGRLADKYGMDKEINMPVVSVVYGQFSSGAFTAAMKEALQRSGSAPKKADLDKPIEAMSINELRTKLRAEAIDFPQTATKAELADLLATATA